MDHKSRFHEQLLPQPVQFSGWLFNLCLLLFQLSGANAAAPPAKGESARMSAEATRIDHSPRLDGTLNDPLWQSAKPITEFRQREPHEGEP